MEWSWARASRCSVAAMDECQRQPPGHQARWTQSVSCFWVSLTLGDHQWASIWGMPVRSRRRARAGRTARRPTRLPSLPTCRVPPPAVGISRPTRSARPSLQVAVLPQPARRARHLGGRGPAQPQVEAHPRRPTVPRPKARGRRGARATAAAATERVWTSGWTCRGATLVGMMRVPVRGPRLAGPTWAMPPQGHLPSGQEVSGRWVRERARQLGPHRQAILRPLALLLLLRLHRHRPFRGIDKAVSGSTHSSATASPGPARPRPSCFSLPARLLSRLPASAAMPLCRARPVGPR